MNEERITINGIDYARADSIKEKAADLDGLEPCPVCGAKTIVIHMVDTYDRADFGWVAGCPRYKRNDGIHDKPMIVSGLGSEDAAINAWNKKVKEESNG